MELSKQDQAIVIAQDKGYFLSKGTGDAYSSKKGVRKLSPIIDSKGYLFIGIKLPEDNNRRRVYIHRLMAFKKFGDQVFAPGTVVRHLDNNPLNNTYNNIAIGTQADNLADSEYVFHGGNFRERSFSDEKELELYQEFLDTGISMTKQGKKYGVSRQTIFSSRRRVKNFIEKI